MPTRIVNQDSVLREARELVKSAQGEVLITSPLIRQRSANALLRDVLPRIESSDLRVRLVYRVKEASDLEITELEGIKALEEAGCEIRFSNRLHAKLVLVDDRAAIVSSSNLTATAGYGDLPSDWRNEELGVLLESESGSEALADLRAEFNSIWDGASALDERTLGVAMDFPNVDEFAFVAIRSLRRGEYAMATDLDGRVILGRISQVTAYNRSFPGLTDAIWVTQGYSATGQRGGPPMMDLQSLFSHPSKDHGYLVAKSFHEPASAFQIARVEVLKAIDQDHLVSAVAPVAPGSDVKRADTDLLIKLIGDGDLSIGRLHHHEEVPVLLKSPEILSKHLSVLGMTGSGKSNSLKVLIRNLLTDHQHLRVVVVDTHGEYVPIATELASAHKQIDVEVRRWLLDEEVMPQLMRLTRKDNALHQELIWELYDAGPTTRLDDFLIALEGSGDDKRMRLAAAASQQTDLCLFPEQQTIIVDSAGDVETFDEPGLYILNLRSSGSLEDRSARAAAVMRFLFERAKQADGDFPVAVVIDEAQNFAPEQQTGWLSRARESFDALFQIATEGRKFGIAMIVSTQRPARVNKDVLSQCNTHMIFRVANLEDLEAIGASFEAASAPLLDELPGFDTGVCVVGGTALNMVSRVAVPLFGDEA